MLNEETYENFWELFDRIPSIDHPGQSVTKEILDFDHLHPTEARARLIDRNGKILDVKSMGFDNKDHHTFLQPISGICGKQLLLFKNGLVFLN